MIWLVRTGAAEEVRLCGWQYGRLSVQRLSWVTGLLVAYLTPRLPY